MYPVLFEIFRFQVGTYGLLYAVAFLAALRVATHYARRAGIDTGRILDLGIYALLAGFAGAKLLLYLLDFRLYFGHPVEILRTWRSAGVFHGGLLAAVAVSVWYLRRHRVPVAPAADAAAPALALAQSIGRLGCFAAGCCYGLPSERPWAITFRDPRAHQITGVPLDLPLLPTQLFHAAGDLAIFLVLVLLHRRRPPPGTVFWAFLLLHGAGRFGLEFLRGDYRGPAIGGLLTFSQILALAGALLGAVMLARGRAASPSRSPR
ncbi:MAG: prolipoprotein diacylglyceryl transferase [Acidobacteria bacterium]|nr:prolipoprotein diacylglyceryl transferase [Acidobacteriota bacterium]